MLNYTIGSHVQLLCDKATKNAVSSSVLQVISAVWLIDLPVHLIHNVSAWGVRTHDWKKSRSCILSQLAATALREHSTGLGSMKTWNQETWDKFLNWVTVSGVQRKLPLDGYHSISRCVWVYLCLFLCMHKYVCVRETHTEGHRNGERTMLWWRNEIFA